MNYSIPKMPGTHGAVDYKTEMLSGLTVAVALAIAFAMIAGFSPLTGLYAAFVMGLAIIIVDVNVLEDPTYKIPINNIKNIK